ncbi:tyrosine-protein phosphatase [Paraburkholderia oxyphila]|uniref:tyrosine-protein phosphatase n=1 Tax=Paraburkholderia oxyphila TaxID=614212 RepID=UPI001FE11698|nr:tyrosine-protein phosphatase [Paraburkholderia oxyphila]
MQQPPRSPRRRNALCRVARIAGVSLATSVIAHAATAQTSTPAPGESAPAIGAIATAQPDADRLIPMDHVQNLRDLGGLIGADGRRVAPHRLYRSGNPALGTPADFARLAALHLDDVVDFRAASEKTPAEAAFGALFPWMADPVLAGDLSPAAIVPMLKRSTPEQMHRFMVDLYRQFPQDYQAQFARFLKLAEADKTLLYHCTAGKDRTGFATVLLLSALGVDRATVIANYLESNRYNAAGNARALAQLQKIGVAPAVAQPLLDVDPDYIGAAMAVIDERYGGMQHYLVDVLHVDIEKIRRNYLVAAAD